MLLITNKILIAKRTTFPGLKNLYNTVLTLQTSRLTESIFKHNLNVNQEQQKRLVHNSLVRRDMESAFKAIGAGIAITGVTGPGIGIGILFGNFLSGVSRNPSLSKELFGATVLGIAFCEALGLLAALIAFISLYG